MMDKTKKRNNRWKLFHKALALGSLLLLMGVMIHPLFGNGNISAQADSHFLDVTLEQTTPEEGFLMIPGVAIPQDIKAEITNTTGRSYVYVKIVEKNNDNNYLLYELAEGWQQLQDLDGTPIPGVYYRYCDAEGTSSWPILNNQQITVNPETVTWSFLERLSADATQATWPRLIYDAYGVALEYSDEQITPLEGWSIADGQIHYSPFSPSDDVIGTLAVPEGLSVDAYNVTLQDSSGVSLQPYESVTVSLPVGDAEAAIVLHVLDSGSKAIDAISAGKAVGLKTGADEITIVEKIDATVQNHFAVFEATSFSPYYVVSGHNDTLMSWWQDSSGITRYNLDQDIYSLDATSTESDKTKTFIVEPGSSFYMWVENQANPTWTVTENKSNGHITVNSVANDSVGKVIRVSSDAVAGESLTFTAGGWTVIIQVDASVITDTFDLPIYIGINMKPNDAGNSYVGNEPRVSGNDTFPYVYITDPNTLNTLTMALQNQRIVPVSNAAARQYLKTTAIEEVLDKFLPGTDDKSVTGLIGLDMDTEDENHDDAIDLGGNKYENIDWVEIAAALVTNYGSKSELKATDGETVNGSNSHMYELRPYVIKVQTSKHVGWHIQACFVPIDASESMVWVNYDENLPTGAKVEYMNVPLRTPLKDSSGGYKSAAAIYMVEPTKSSGDTNAYNRISESEYITLADGRKLRFIGWNTQPDGSGCHVGLGGSLNIQSCTNHTGAGATHDSLEKGGTLYAFWSDISERLEVHKVLQIDGTDDRSSKQNFNFRVTLTLPENYQFEANKDKFLIELFNVSDDSYVANSKKDANMVTSAVTMDISFNEDQYAVIYAPVGTQYKVEETGRPSQDYKLIGYQNNEGTIQGLGKDPNVIVTNSYKSTKGFLNLKKTVEGEGADQNQLFNFVVTFDATNVPADKSNTVEFTLYDPLGNEMIDTDGRVTINEANEANEANESYTVWLKHGERIVFSGLEAGTTYEITEAEVENYAATVKTQVDNAEVTEASNPASGTIVEDKFTNVVYTNTYTPAETNGTLTIKKEFSGCTPEEGESFVFTVTDKDGNEVAEVVIYGADSKTIQVPYGDYTVTEDDSWSWRYKATVSPSQPVTVSSTSNPTVTFTNTKSNPNWLDASAGVTNDFGSKTATPHN